MPEMVNHPSHYMSKDGEMEVIDVIEHFTTDIPGIFGFCTGNAIKYILRWPNKDNPVEDLKKAQWYIQKMIDMIEKENK